MKRKLLRQIANEWRSNFWLVIELMIVSVAIWYMLLNIYTIYKVAHLPNGYHTENTYVMYWQMTPDAMDIIAGMDSLEKNDYSIAQLKLLYKTIEDMPGVTALGVGRNIMPYNYNYHGSAVSPADCDTIQLYGNIRCASPEIPEVMGWEPLAGASSTSDLKAALERGEIIFTRGTASSLPKYISYDTIDAATPGIDPSSKALKSSAYMVGKDVTYGDRTYKVGAVVENMRRGYYEVGYDGGLIFPINTDSYEITDYNEVIVRVDPARRADFVKAFDEAMTQDRLSLPLVYIPEMTYQDDIADIHHAEVDIEMRNQTIIIIFLLVSIFLGMMGTFGARTVKRQSEIAIRISTGATRADIFRRLIGEGALLVTLATIPAAVIDWAVAWYIEDLPNQLGNIFSPWEFLLVNIAFTFILVIIMTVAGIWFPARRAMALDPATALHAQ